MLLVGQVSAHYLGLPGLRLEEHVNPFLHAHAVLLLRDAVAEELHRPVAATEPDD